VSRLLTSSSFQPTKPCPNATATATKMKENKKKRKREKWRRNPAHLLLSR